MLNQMNLKTGLLIGTNPKKISSILKLCLQQDTLNALYIKLLSEVKLENLRENPNQNSQINKELFRNTTLGCYSVFKNIENIDIRVLLSNFKDPSLIKVTTSKPIDIMYCDNSYSTAAVENFANNYIENKSKNFEIISLPCIDSENVVSVELEGSENNNSNFREYDYVVLGGTFDRLHLGHKLLLTEAVLRCRKRITVGVCTETILKSKILSELIEPCEKRIEDVRNFLSDVEPSIEYNVVPINDIYGPTKSDPDLEMIVVSTETIRGAEKINEYRESSGLKKLVVHEINLIESLVKSDHEEKKISSSNTRMRLLGELLKPPTPRPNLLRKPYIIGLTGGIASGKSTISQYLENFGCGRINCDEITHNVYEVGSSGYKFITETFGFDILNEDCSVNRKKLGGLVFNDKKLLHQLNQGLWPIILNKVKEDIAQLHHDKDVVIIEAALLIQAEWINECHEIWCSVIPSEEAVKRLQKRNNLTIDEANQRISSQPSNKEYVAYSNIVFCSLWDVNFTMQQVEKAWCNLQKRLL